MSLLGKVFAFLNILGVVGVLAMGMMTYGKKIAWANANAQQELMLKGLPLNDQELDKQGRPRVDNLLDANVKVVVPGPVVRTQSAEVERVHGILQGELTAINDKPKKLARLADVVLPFATDYRRYADLVLIKRWLKGDQEVGNLRDQMSRAVKDTDALLARLNDPAAKMQDPRQQGRTFDEALTEYAHLQTGPAKAPFVAAYLATRAAAQKEGKPVDFETTFTGSIDRLIAEVQAEYDAVYKAAATGEITCKEPGADPGNPAASVTTTKKAGAQVQRAAIVVYLYNLTPRDEKFKAADWAAMPAVQRVVGVVGLENFPDPIIEQAARIGYLTRQVQAEGNLPYTVTTELVKQIERERMEFVAQHARMIAYLKEQKGIIDERELRLARAEVIAKKQEELAEASKKINDDLNRILGDARVDTAERVKVIRDLAQSLLEVRLKTRDAAEFNQRIEQEIRRLERLYR